MADDKFSSGRYTYPLNIEADEYGGNYVLYQIGVSGRSSSSYTQMSLSDPNGMTYINTIGEAKAKNSNLSGVGLDNDTAEKYVQALPYAAAAGFGGVGLAGKDPTSTVAAASTIGNIVRSKVGDISAINYLTLKESICLYMPDVSIK